MENFKQKYIKFNDKLLDALPLILRLKLKFDIKPDDYVIIESTSSQTIFKNIHTNKYFRSLSPNLSLLMTNISNCYLCEKTLVNYTLITISGMHAITTSLLSIAINNKWNQFNLIYSDEMYCDTHRFIFDFSETYSKINTWSIDVETQIEF